MKPTLKDIENIYNAALEREPGTERDAFIAAATDGKLELRAKVEALLETNREVGDFLMESPLAGEITLQGPALAEAPGTVIGRYKLLEKIGEGGFGVVWAAEQKTPVKRRVALKIIKLGMDTKQVVARFEAERQALALMDHPNIAKVLDAGATNTGRPYFVMELVKGIPIVEYCDKERLSTQARLDLFVKVCHAIQHAHQKGIIHRDIKPSNILITLHDGAPVPRVIDFGIAKATQQELTEKTIYTQHHQFIGTPAYMSPEQAEMSGLDIDTRADIYSLGVLLYELLTGTTPFSEEQLLKAGYAEMTRIIREQDPPRPSMRLSQMLAQPDSHRRLATHHSSLTTDLDWIVMKCLEKNRTRRYDTANGLALDVDRHLNHKTVMARPPSTLYQLQKSWQRNKVFYTAACMVVASLIIGISISLWQTWEATRARQREQTLREQAEAGERRQRLNTYAADMKLGWEYLKKHDLQKVAELLDRYKPQSDEADDLRDIEWRYLEAAIAGDHTDTFPHEAEVRGVSLSQDGTRLASITLSGKVRLFDVASQTLLQHHGGGNMSYGVQEGSVALSPDGRFLAADQQGTLMVWDANAVIVLAQAHVAAPIHFSPDSHTLAAVTPSGLRLWSTRDWTKTRLLGTSLPGGTSHVHVLTFTPDSSRIIFALTRFASKLIVYNLADDSVAGELTGLDSAHVIAASNAMVVAGARNGEVCVWDLISRERVRMFAAHGSFVVGVALSPDGKILATGGNDREIRLWDTQTFERVGFLKGHHSQVWNLTFSGNGRYLASGSMDRSVKLWEWGSEIRRARSAATTDSSSAHSNSGTTAAQPIVGGGDSPVNKGISRTHSVRPGDSIQTAIDAAAPGDRIELAPGTYMITEMIVVNRPLTIVGVAQRTDGEPLPTILQGAEGVLYVIQIDTAVGSATEIRNLHIESHTSGIEHLSGDLMLAKCSVTISSQLEFQKVISLKATGNENSPTDTVTIDGCTLVAKYVGDTAGRTVPDVDLVLAEGGTRYVEITVAESRLTNEAPNAISNGIETRGINAHLTIQDNHIHCQGMGIVMPNHIGAVDIRNNVIWSARKGIATGNESPERSNIIGNHITVDDQGLEVNPAFVRELIAPTPSACIRIGGTSAGVATFFGQRFIGQGANFRVEDNVLTGNPKYGISLVDSPEPESYGPPTPNTSHLNVIARNDFVQLQADWDIALGASTHDNLIADNVGVGAAAIFKEAGDKDRNTVRTN